MAGQPGLFDWRNWGGSRKGAGRRAKQRGDGKRVHASHSKREKVLKSRPVHLTVNFVEGLPNLRREGLAQAVLGAMEARERGCGFRVVHFALLSNHLHLICEAEDNSALTSGMRGLNVRVARAVNRELRRKGRVVAERFHMHVLRTKREVQYAVKYVLRNAERHGAWRPLPCELVGRGGGEVNRSAAFPDPLSSAANFPHWRERELVLSPRQSPASLVDLPGTWLLQHSFDGIELSLTDTLRPIKGACGQGQARPRGDRQGAGASNGPSNGSCRGRRAQEADSAAAGRSAPNQVEQPVPTGSRRGRGGARGPHFGVHFGAQVGDDGGVLRA
jgi:REP element-mobilizing transposase RayT